MKSRGNKEVQEDIPAWQSIYCSLILIMLVLFLMLVSYSVGDQKKMLALKSNFCFASDRKANLGKVQVLATSRQAGDVTESLWIEEAVRRFQQTGVKFSSADAFQCEKTTRGLKLKIKSDVLFPAGQAVLNRQIYPYLDEVSNLAVAQDLNLRIEGHTDDAPVHNAAYPSNWELSASRATNVLRYCLEAGKVPVERLSAAGFGSYQPLMPNDTLQGRILNRRIEIYLTKGQDTR